MKKKKNNNKPFGERLARLEADTENLIRTIEDMKDNHLGAMNQKLDNLYKIYNRRLPLWASGVITLLSSGAVGMFVLYLAAIGRI